VHVDRSRLDVRRGLPDRLEQACPRLHAAPALGQDQEQLVFCRREVEHLTADAHAMLGAVDRDRARCDRIGRRRSTRCRSTQDRSDAKHELPRAEGLREVVIGAQREASNAIRLLAPSGEHQHGHIPRRLVGAKLLEDLEAREAREHEIEHDQRGTLLARSRERVRSRRGGPDTIAGFGQMIRDQRDDVGLIVDDEDPFACRSPPAHSDPCRSRRWIFATIISMAIVLCPP
jgi:hypothetical protein